MNYIGTNKPVQPATGSIRFDTSTCQVNIYDGSNWVPVTGSTIIMDKQLITEELTFGSTTFYTVEAKNYDWDELYIWARETFGRPRDGTRVGETLNGKWFISGGTFYFDEQKHRDWFLVKWL